MLSFNNIKPAKEKGSANPISGKGLDRIKDQVRLKLSTLFDSKQILTKELTDEEKAQAREQIDRQITKSENGSRLTPEQRVRVVTDLLYEIIGLGPLEALIQDPSVAEIMVNGPNEIYVERNGKIEPTDLVFRNGDHLVYVIERILAPVGRRVTYAEPYTDARLPDGSRVNISVQPIAIGGPYITIRKFSREILSFPQLIQRGALTEQVAGFLRACVQVKLNLVISGGASSGKTTLLDILADLIAPTDRIIIIEDTAEIQLRNHHVVRLEMRPSSVEGRLEVTIRDLLKNALRMRPDRIIVGEVRGEEALDMLQAMNTGHDGSMTTLHANGPIDVLDRIATMALSAPLELTETAVERQIRAAIDLIVHLERRADGARRITHICEVRTRLKAGDEPLVDLFTLDRERGASGGQLVPTGARPSFLGRIQEQQIQLPPGLFS